MNIPQNRKTIAGIGSALMDLCLTESDEFLSGAPEAQKGGMVMVDHTVIDSIAARSDKSVSVVPGGSACNTIVGVSRLGGKARFIGKRGGDELGDTLEKSLTAAGVEPVLAKSPTATGRVLSIITPDAQRSMLTCLGASSEIKPEEIKASYFEDCAVVHIEGYLLFNPAVFKAAIKAAKDAGALVSLDLASYTVVEAARDILNEVLDCRGKHCPPAADAASKDCKDGLIDILIANEDEAAAFTGIKDDEDRAINELGRMAKIAVMNMGKRGSVIAHDGTTTKAPVHKVCQPIDTTGAGDLWIAGFLHSLVCGFDIATCARVAAACGYEVCQVIGAHIPDDGWERIASVM